MELTNLTFAMVFAAAVLGCLTVLVIVWYQRPKPEV